MSVEQKLEELKQHNFKSVSETCLANYKAKNGNLPSENDHWRFLVSDYFATGEGFTCCILVTQAHPKFDEEFTTKEYRAVREFHELFGTQMLYGLDFLSEGEFFEKYSMYIPEVVKNINKQPCYYHFYTEFHFNLS